MTSVVSCVAARTWGLPARSEYLEYSDLAGSPHVRAATQLTTEVIHLNHTDKITVFLTEQSCSAQVSGVVKARGKGPHRVILYDLLVDNLLYLRDLWPSQRLIIREIEPELVRSDGGSGLNGIFAIKSAEGVVEKMSCSVIRSQSVPTYR